MKSFELWWIALIHARNMGFILVLFGGLHLYFYVQKRQSDTLRFTTEPFATNSRRFLFKSQVRDNMFRTLIIAVPTITGYEAITYWAFANGYLGFVDLANQPVLFWGWFAALVLLAPLIHSFHFTLATACCTPNSSTRGFMPCITAMWRSAPGRASPCTRWSTSSISRQWSSNGPWRCIR